jgi:hypothetical protein
MNAKLELMLQMKEQQHVWTVNLENINQTKNQIHVYYVIMEPLQMNIKGYYHVINVLLAITLLRKVQLNVLNVNQENINQILDQELVNLVGKELLQMSQKEQKHVLIAYQDPFRIIWDQLSVQNVKWEHIKINREHLNVIHV